MHNPDYIVSVIPKQANRIDSGVEVYLTPTDVVRQALLTVRAEWLANPATITNKPDDDLGCSLTASPLAVPSFESRTTTPPNGRSINCRTALGRAARLPSRSDQVLMPSPTMEGLVELLRQQAMMWSPSNSNEDYMQQVSGRAPSIEPWDQVRCDSVEHFLDDMEKTGAISEFIKREYEWIAL
jgi:hypothetical protein